MGIKTGIGVGAAQVFDTSSIVNNYAKLLQKQQQDEAKFQTEIADLISRVDTKGVRDQDKAEIAKMYSATKDLYAQAAATKNFQEKALLKAKISKAVGDINEYAARSADFSKRFVDLNNRIAQDYYDYDPKVLDKLREVGSKSLLQMGSDAQLDPMNYLKRPNLKSRENLFNSIFKRGENFAKATTQNLPGGMKQVVKVTPDSFIITNIEQGINSDPEYKRLAFNNLRESGVDVKSMTPEQISAAVVANELARYKETFGNKYVGEPREQSGPSKSEMKQARSISERASIINRIQRGDQSAAQELLEISSLPFGSTSKFMTGSRPAMKGQAEGPKFKMLRITIPKSDWQDAMSKNPALKDWNFKDKDSSSKIKAFDFDLTSADLPRGLNEFMNAFSRGANVEFRDIKGSSSNSNSFDVEEYLKSKGLK